MKTMRSDWHARRSHFNNNYETIDRRVARMRRAL